MMEENLHFVQVHLQWENEAAWQAYMPELCCHMPQVERQTAEVQAREFVRGLLHAQGMGRHSRADVAAIGNADLSALSIYLEEKPYFMGEQPTSLDATAYAFLSRSLWVPYESPLKTHAKTLPNLHAYCERMRERYYSGGH